MLLEAITTTNKALSMDGHRGPPTFRERQSVDNGYPALSMRTNKKYRLVTPSIFYTNCWRRRSHHQC
uniref:Uncharacterized protein n=1 Tax=Setaria italica TaxID=4555 RepID=K3YBH4_SETIT